MEAGKSPLQDDKAWRDAVRAAWLSQKLDMNITYESNQHDNLYSADISTAKNEKNETDRFLRCWGHGDCRSCLGMSACSWCPFSATCVPNDYLVPALAPAWEGDYMCPYWAERWELRTRPLGCQVSTITSLTALVAGAVTLTVVLLVWTTVVLVRKLRQRQLWSFVRTKLWRAPEEQESTSTPPSSPDQPPSEQCPLLSDIR
ncbi:hypothetical protein SBRCBS47491_002300 [Sporothrix bragantina]|uniref:PSI domain-containing protein n=1 Tax=Sporothrix bragantina TaxID=671064 RepID=A0ABP0B5L4_9PEZI